MDKELKLHLEAMEARLMGRINGVMEQLLEVQGNLRDLRSEHDATREMVSALPAIESRLDKLEGQG